MVFYHYIKFIQLSATIFFQGTLTKKGFFVSIIAILKFMVAETVDDIGIHTRGLNTVILEMVWGQKMVNSNTYVDL